MEKGIEMKKLLILGGSSYIIPVIQKAKKMGLYVITCDYIPENLAHKYSDEYHNISIIEKESVLGLAKKLQIDGIMSFACDPGVVTASYVAEKMNLAFQGSYKSTSILQDKGLFRKFLTENGFNCPKAKSYNDIKEALFDIDYYNWPVIVKPVDSAGSKGVTKVTNSKDLTDAIEIALNDSHNGHFIIEDFLTFKGFHSSADCFTLNGELKYCTFSDQLFDTEASNPYTPSLIIWPSSMEIENQNYLTKEIQRLMTLLDMKNGIYNIETCVASDGKPYIMEVSPRGGGCKIAEIQSLATGIDFIEAEIKSALGEAVDISQKNIDGVWAEYVIHNKNEFGILKEITIDDEIKRKYVKMIDFSVKSGDYVEPFTGANKSLGNLFLRFESRDELNSIMNDVDSWLKIVLE